MPQQLIQHEDGTYTLLRRAFEDAYLDEYTEPPSQDPRAFDTLTNAIYRKGGFTGRWGNARFDTTTAINMTAAQLLVYQSADGATTRGVAIGQNAAATKLIKSFDGTGALQNTAVFTPTTVPRAALSRGYMYFASGTAGDRQKWNGNDSAGSGVTTWGIAMPASSTLAASASGTGSVTVRFWRDYCFAFRNSTTGQISDISDFTRLSPVTSKAQVDLSSIDTDTDSANTGTNQRVVLATSDGGARTRLYLVGTIANNTVTTLTDSLTEANLLIQDVYAEFDEFGQGRGAIGNERPPTTGKFPTLHRGRIYMIVNKRLRFSKNAEEVSTSSGFEIAGRWEECWPPEYEFPLPISTDATGIFSDGTTLYVGSKDGLTRLYGDGPLNFLPPEKLFSETGVFSQETFTPVFVTGRPVGAMWLTPDFRLVASDFRSVTDISFPFVKSSLPTSVPSNVFVLFAYYDNLSFFAFVSGTTWLLYDLNLQKWYKWTQAQNTRALMFWTNPSTNAPQILWSGASETEGRLFKVDSTVTTDINSAGNAVDIAAEWRTTYGDWGFTDKLLWPNRVRVVTDNVAPTVTLTGIAYASGLQSATNLVANSATAALINPAGEFAVSVAAKASGYSLYRLYIKDAAAKASKLCLGQYAIDCNVRGRA